MLLGLGRQAANAAFAMDWIGANGTRCLVADSIGFFLLFYWIPAWAVQGDHGHYCPFAPRAERQVALPFWLSKACLALLITR